MSFVVIIPARYDSERLPGKPLLPIAGKPMIQHVYDRAKESDAMGIIIATDDERIVEAAKWFVDDPEAEIIMTAKWHESGTDRVAEAARQHRLGDDWVVVNVQGDEPLINPETINECAALMEDESVDIATMATPLETRDELENPNIVKVVTDYNNNALYFSRCPIPYHKEGAERLESLGQHGIYAFRNSALQKMVSEQQSPLELCEGCEQLRALSLGMTIKVGRPSVEPGPGVDTEEGLERVRAIYAAENKGRKIK